MQEALAAAARMRAAVSRAVVGVDGDEIAVTATTGAAVWRSGDSAAHLIARADQALFGGKRSRLHDHDC